MLVAVDVVDDADDELVLALEDGHVAYGIFIGPKTPGGCLVENDDILAGAGVGPGEVAAVEAHADGFEISGRDHVDECSMAIALGIRLALHCWAVPAAVAEEWKIVSEACGFDTGYRSDLLQHITHDCIAQGGGFGEAVSLVVKSTGVWCVLDVDGR